MRELDQKPISGENAVFKAASKVSRKQPDVAPALGQYETSNYTIEQQLKKQKQRPRLFPPTNKRHKDIFASTLSNSWSTNKQRLNTTGHRFERKRDSCEDFLGPGYYCMPREFEQADVRVKKNIMFSKDERFKKQKSNVPGPGQYQDNVINLWNKRTFNLCFNNWQDS